MKQAINFYHEEFKPLVVVLPLSLIIKTISSSVILLLLSAAVLQGLIYKIEVDKQGLLQNKAAIEGDLAALEIEKKIPPINMGLESQVREVKTVVKEKARINSLISSQKKDQQVKIHGYFEALVNLDLPGIWLTSIEIFSRGLDMKMAGVTLETSSLPKYLQALQKAETFNSLSFELVNMQKLVEQDSGIKFQLSSSHGLEVLDADEAQLSRPGT